MARRPAAEMAELKEKALRLIRVNPTLSMAAVARHFEVAEATVSKWFDEAGLKRWGA